MRNPNSQSATDARKLINGHFNRGNLIKSCAAIGSRLDLKPKTIAIIAGGGYCGQHTATRLHKLVRNPASVVIRKYKPRLYIPCDTKEQVTFIVSRLPARRRLAILLEAAELMEGL